MQAGQTMGLRFKEKGQYLRSFVADKSLFIDIMMNVGIIFYAASETGDAALREIALRHCQTTRRVLVRGDGSHRARGAFRPGDGRVPAAVHAPGLSRRFLLVARAGLGAVWLRHRAIGYTRDPHFLETAEACADFYLEHTPRTACRRGTTTRRRSRRTQPDSSAAAIAASGLWNLAGLAATPERQGAYRQAAVRISTRLTTPEYLGSSTPGWEGILKRGVYHIHKGLGVDESWPGASISSSRRWSRC